MSEAVVNFKNVTKSYPSYYHLTGGIKTFIFHIYSSIHELYQRRLVLEDLSFDIYKGESFGFIGRNGAGKSTLLGLIAGVLQPDKGKVAVHDRVSPLLELGAGFHPELTGRENIMLNGVLLGLTRVEVQEHFQEIIDFSELQDFIDQPVRTYSSGMYAKLGFSVVATLKPEILLVDEILSVGDLAFVRKCDERFQKFRGDPNVTIVLVSHALETITKVCDRAAWIENKRIRIIGPAKDVVKEYFNANQPKFTVPDAIHPTPPHVCWGGTSLLDCTRGPAKLSLRLNGGTADLHLRATLIHWADGTPICEWSVVPQTVLLSYASNDWTLAAQPETGNLSPISLPREDLGPFRPDNAAGSLALRLRGELHGEPCTPDVWIAVAEREAARQAWDRHRGEILLRLGRPPLPHAPFWPAGVTVRVVARTIEPRDTVGNFAVGVAGMLTACGIPARLYAYQSCAALVGIVSSIGDLLETIQPQDVIFYHYFSEDEFLPQILGLPCKKLLYFHNVPPSDCFRDDNPAFADALDRSRAQFPLFFAFDGVLANSRYSLSAVEQYFQAAPLRDVCPPCVDSYRLARLTPAPVELPAGNFLLWVGRLVPLQRPELALEIFQALSEQMPDIHFVMVGGGGQDFPHCGQKVDSAIKALPAGIHARLLVYESLSDAQLAFLYRRARLLLCTSVHEEFCLSVLEARTFGLPVATCGAQAARKQLDTGSALSLPATPREAANAIAAKLTNTRRSPSVAVPAADDTTVASLLEGLFTLLRAEPRKPVAG
ncbi:MAG: hypothetical protein CXZ00_16420 [Acidobacteria bacterium]|nr:MAG: hypothetical protein CXZ00_16420 [Acidobacteriota bacterium]